MYGAFYSCRYWYGLPCNFVIYKSSAPFHWMDVSFWAQFEPRCLFKLYWSTKISSTIKNFDRNICIFVIPCSQRRFSLRRFLGRRLGASDVPQSLQIGQRRQTYPWKRLKGTRRLSEFKLQLSNCAKPKKIDEFITFQVILIYPRRLFDLWVERTWKNSFWYPNKYWKPSET